MTATSQCELCGAPMRWVRTAANGKPMPLDPEPVEDGNVFMENGEAHVLVDGQLSLDGVERAMFKSHFATCPRWRK